MEPFTEKIAISNESLTRQLQRLTMLSNMVTQMSLRPTTAQAPINSGNGQSRSGAGAEVAYSDEDDDGSSIVDEEEEHEKKLVSIMRSLKHYEPGEHMKEALKLRFSNESLLMEDALLDQYLKCRQLDSENVYRVLNTLLCIEDLTTMQAYAELMQENVHLTRIGKLRFSFLLSLKNINAENVLAPHLDEVVLVPKASLLDSPQTQDLIAELMPHAHEKLKLGDPRLRHVTQVDQVNRSSIHVRFKREAYPGDNLIVSQKYFVIMRSRRTPIRFMYRALELLSEWPQLRSYLFPLSQLPKQIECYSEPEDLQLFNKRIQTNSEQLQAVRQIVNGPNPNAPYIVFGPPGTGKTTTIVEAILQVRLLQPRSRILVTAGSNSACDTIALRICEYFNSNSRLKAHIAQQARLPRLVTMDVKPQDQLIRVFSRSIFVKGLKGVPSVLLSHSNCKGNIFDFMSVDDLRKFGIIVATLCTVGRLVTENLGKFNFFTHVFIDEAGASTEPESLIGIMGIKQQEDCHVILSGDHKQLGAVIKSDRAASLGLGHSLMERLLRSPIYGQDTNGNYDHSLQTRLRRNYRSHPEIVRLFNTLYYNKELIAEAPANEVNLAAKWANLPNNKSPIIFQATHGVTHRAPNSTSSINILEVEVIKWYVQRLVNTGINGVSVCQDDVGIIAPYAAQCNLLTEMLRNIGCHRVEVGCVEAYQGREKPIIIVSLVRSFANMGFVRNPRRLNVMLSRAKSLLILIGNPVTLRHHRDFKFVINECKASGNYLFKKKDVAQWQRLLQHYNRDMSHLEDESESESDTESDQSSVAFIPWCSQMPGDITVREATAKLPQKTSSLDITVRETTSKPPQKTSSLDITVRAATPKRPQITSSSESEESEDSSGSTSSDLDSTILLTVGPERIPIRSSFLRACAGAPNYAKKKMQH